MRFAILTCWLVACGGSDKPGAQPSELTAELEPFQGFSFDSGYLPQGSPAQIDLKAAAGGKLTFRGGTMALDGKLTLKASLKSSITGASYDGPLKGAPDLNIVLSGSAPFDASAAGQKATLTATVSPSELVKLPLAEAIGVPLAKGDLDLKLVGGTVTADFVTDCAKDGKVSGTVSLSGSIKLGGIFNIEVPLLGSKAFNLPEIVIDVAPGGKPLSLPVHFKSPSDPSGIGCGSLAQIHDGTSSIADGGSTIMSPDGGSMMVVHPDGGTTDMTPDAGTDAADGSDCTAGAWCTSDQDCGSGWCDSAQDALICVCSGDSNPR